jgi:hypothetical protein
VTPESPYQGMPNRDGCIPTIELLDRYLSGELDASERATVEAHLATCAYCTADLADLRRVRDALRAAVGRTPVPSGLADSIRVRRSSGLAAILPLSGARRWMYAAAALLVVAFGTWMLTRRDPYQPPIATNLPPAEAQLAAVLSIGLVDHVECAIRYGYQNDEYTHEEILDKLDEEYAGLASIVRDRAPGYRLTLGHHCKFNGRKYVHMILKKDSSVISLAITERTAADSLPDPALAATAAQGLPIYASNLDGFEVAGFESGRFLVFSVSNMARAEQLQFASAIARPVDAFLRTVPA